MELKFYTPTECLLEKIKNDDILSRFCSIVNDGMIKNKSLFPVNKPIIFDFMFDEQLNSNQCILLKKLYKGFGWLLTIQFIKLNDENNYLVSLVEAT